MDVIEDIPNWEREESRMSDSGATNVNNGLDMKFRVESYYDPAVLLAEAINRNSGTITAKITVYAAIVARKILPRSLYSRIQLSRVNVRHAVKKST